MSSITVIQSTIRLELGEGPMVLRVAMVSDAGWNKELMRDPLSAVQTC
jgi:hypothetical protein